MEMIIGRSLPALDSSRTMGASAGVTITRVGKCRMSVGTGQRATGDRRSANSHRTDAEVRQRYNLTSLAVECDSG